MAKSGRNGNEIGPGPGRPKGSKNKFTTLKNSFLKAYQAKDGFGGDEALKLFAKKNPEAFLQMIKSLLPKDLDVKTDGEIILKVIYEQGKAKS